jgi:hypothetical protein
MRSHRKVVTEMSGVQPQLWRKPAPLGYGSALDAVTNVAAPLLAGFNITVIATVAAASDRFRWPGFTTLILIISAMLLVASLQFGFHARQHLYSAADVADWWTPEDLEVQGRTDRLQREQHVHYARWERSSLRARIAYNAGIVTLAVGIALVLSPPYTVHRTEAGFRWAAAALAFAGAIAELVWGAWSTFMGARE